MVKPAGGRGKKAPYETITLRVPIPLREEIEKQVDAYREFVVNGINPEPVKPEGGILSSPSREEVINQAKEILKQKKSAKQSLEKLLQVLYGGDISLKT